MAKVNTTLYGDLALLPLEALNISKEIIEWKTDIFISDNGNEEREKLRTNARKKIFYNFFENYHDKIPSFITEYGAYTELWALPLWSERQYIGVVSSGGTTLTCVTNIYDFRDTSLALLYESYDSWQILEISTVGPTELNLSTTLEAFTKAILVPVRVGTVNKDILRSSTGYNAYSEFGFDVIDVLDTTESVPSQYLSDDYYIDELFKKSNRYKSTISNNLYKDDFVLGNVNKSYTYNNNRIIKPFFQLFDNQTDIFNFRKFLTRRSGRYRQYWEPTFEVDLTNKSSGLITNTIFIESDGFLDWTKQRKYLGFLDTSGTWYFREIISTVQSSPVTVQLTLDSALNIQANDLDTISFLGLRRFNTDRITLNWRYGGSVMETTIDTIEVAP